jgi:hypothetical protein
MRFCFVSTSRGSYFMTELLAALAAATEAAGHSAELVLDEFPPPADDLRYVVVPHEFEAWGLSNGAPDAEQRARTIALCTENPGTEWFEATYRLVAEFGAAVSINRSSAAELCRRGVRCEHLQLGYYARWDSWHAERSERAIDVLYLGAADPRRDPLLAGIGARLWSRNCQFLVPPLEPRTAPRADFLKERDKYRRLAGSKILLNLHRTTSAALEWMRFLEAICNGCVVVSEPSLDEHPLIAGEHFVCAPVAGIADAAEALLDDPDRLRAIRDRAYRFVRDELPIEPAGRRLAELGEELPRGSARRGAAPASPPAPAPPADPRAPRTGLESAASPSLDLSALITPLARSSGATARWPAATRLGALSVALDIPRRRRESRAETPSYATADPRVSVLGLLSAEHASETLALLEGIAASRGDEIELLVASGDLPRREQRALTRLLDAHPDLPIVVLPSDVHSLGAARNLLAERARGEYLLVLPPAGGVFPATVERLVAGLDADPRASFSYSMVALIEANAPVGLRGSMPWEAQRLTRENWIDTPALIRRERLLELGGYATDAQLHELEDFDLWCRIAAAGEHGAHVPQVLAWHSPRDSSGPPQLASLPPAAGELIRERSADLFAESDRC